jgi:hypothetical protein
MARRKAPRQGCPSHRPAWGAGLAAGAASVGERRQFSSAILPAWCRKSPKINEVLPLLYLHGLSSKDFTPALEGLLGTDAGLSAATITRLTTRWQDAAHRFADRDLSSVDTYACGPTESTSTSAWTKRSCACSS